MYNLLLVDDEADAREALSNYFPWNEVGFRIAGQAGNGKEALEFLLKNDPPIDVILTDIKMPVMSGIELAEAVYERKHDAQVIFLSSYREFDYAQKALKYRVKNYIVKPAKYQMLLDVFGHLRVELEEQRRERPARDDEGASEEGLLIARIKAYVRSEYRDATLDHAAQQVHLNANYLSFLFKQKTGQNFSDYLIRVKMEVALKLLRDMRYKTYEISEMVGYANAKNFTRTFKSFYGKTPSEYRNGLHATP
ncbi:DNA-binding response regulator [Paenibacillus sp. MY03]|jgi:two-component system response regulator YesN|uniref:response regulator transcription factor n=1 Tax=Paenibacillus sp. MY03 TaxID=302980 RepID=UPI000B3C2491|nr:response regulator [Paenibacillus sp. MY03]OUS74356.1 DNA-binding response regulator [Paenibacillus sp. MY03]